MRHPSNRSLRISVFCALGSLPLACDDADTSVHPRETSFEGTLVQVISEVASEPEKFYLSRDGDWIRLALTQSPAIEANQPIRVTGEYNAQLDQIDVETLEAAPDLASFRLSSNAPRGSMALFLVKDTSLAGAPDPYTHGDVEAQLISGARSADAFLRESSFGQFGLTADIFGWYTMDVGDCSLDRVRSEIETLGAQIDGYVSDDYRHAGFVVIGPNGPCWGGGWGTYGSPDGTGYSWYGPNDAAIYAHEIGHNLGMAHASGKLCAHGEFSPLSGRCQDVEYFDPLDTMGWHWEFRHFSSHRKAQLGWISPDHVQQVGGSGTYTVVPQEQPLPGIQSLLIPIPGTSESYHLEVRSDFGFDAGLGQTVLLRRVRDTLINQTYLIDASPESNPALSGESQRDASLDVGQTFYDAEAGIAISLLGFSGTTATFDIQLNGPSCDDGIANGGETDVDCGGPCSPCADGLACDDHWDCQDYTCESAVCVDADGGGLSATFYGDTTFTSVVTQSIVPTVDWNAGGGVAPGFWYSDNFSIRYEGQILPRYSDVYTFTTTTDDVSRLWIDGQLLIDIGYGTASNTISLVADEPYDIVMEYVEYGGDAYAQLRWESANQAPEIIPQGRLLPAAAASSVRCDISYASAGYGGFGIHNAFVVNDGSTPIQGWSVELSFGPATPQLGWIWGATAVTQGNTLTISGPDVLAPGQVRYFGLGGNYTGPTPAFSCQG